MARQLQIALDCVNPAKLAEFWASALAYEVSRVSDDGDRAFLTDHEGRGPSLLLHRVPEAKTVKNRMHMCLRPTDRTRDEEIERVLALGATIVNDLRKPDRGWAVLADPEGNEFCILMRTSDLPPERQ